MADFVLSIALVCEHLSQDETSFSEGLGKDWSIQQKAPVLYVVCCVGNLPLVPKMFHFHQLAPFY